MSEKNGNLFWNRWRALVATAVAAGALCSTVALASKYYIDEGDKKTAGGAASNLLAHIESGHPEASKQRMTLMREVARVQTQVEAIDKRLSRIEDKLDAIARD